MQPVPIFLYAAITLPTLPRHSRPIPIVIPATHPVIPAKAGIHTPPVRVCRLFAANIPVKTAIANSQYGLCGLWGGGFPLSRE